MRAGQSETRGSVIERRSGPVDGGVTLGAVLREPRRFMRRIVGAVPIVEVAIDAGRARQAVVVVDVAEIASQVGMGARQREAGGRVIERCAGPIRGGVAQGAILRESYCDVTWIVRALEVLQVAGNAGRGERCVLIVDVTRGTGHRGVLAGQRKFSSVVVERGARPVGGAVTQGAILRERRRNVIRIGGALHVLQVAGNARRAERRVLIVHVAGQTGHGGVFAGQRKLGGVVVECRAGPIQGAMAERAVLRESRGGVVRICGRLKLFGVAVKASRAERRVLIVDVASCAGHGGVLAGQRELSRVVVKSRAGPIRSAVTQ